MSLTSMIMGWRLFLRRNPRLLVIPFVLLLVLGLADSFFGRSPQPDHVRYGRYLYQESYLQYSINSQEYNISVIADRDKGSRLDPNYSWESFLKNGVLTRDSSGFKLRWHPKDISLVSKINEEGRGMELSELAYYNGHLYTCDDRTGIVYEVFNGKSIPHYILTDGDGNSPKGFKCEWMAVKDDVLYVGGLGKEWTNAQGEVIGRAPQWVKTIDLEGRVKHLSWVHVYEALRKATGTSYPGYLIHEAVRFHPVLRRWFFLPRRVSAETYDDKLDESRGSNTIISTNENFEDIKVNHIGEKIATHGFSSFAFIPYHEHEVVALKTEEAGETIATYMMVFNLDGTVLLPEVKIADMKFEGIEIV